MATGSAATVIWLMCDACILQQVRAELLDDQRSTESGKILKLSTLRFRALGAARGASSLRPARPQFAENVDSTASSMNLQYDRISESEVPLSAPWPSFCAMQLLQCQGAMCSLSQSAALLCELDCSSKGVQYGFAHAHTGAAVGPQRRHIRCHFSRVRVGRRSVPAAVGACCHACRDGAQVRGRRRTARCRVQLQRQKQSI